MSAALAVPYVVERTGFRLALFDGYALLWVNENEIDVADAIEQCFTPAQRKRWTVTAVRSDDIWEVYRLDRELLTKLV